MSDIKFELAAAEYFEQCGFRVIHGMGEDIWIVRPNDEAEAKRYGTAVFSPRAMEAFGKLIRKEVK